MTTLDSSALNSWGTLADVGCFLVIVGIIGESAELLVKWSKKRKFRDGFAVRFDEINRRRLIWFVKVVRPNILPVETIFVLMVVFGLAIEFLGTHKANGILYENNSELLATNTLISLQVAGLNKEAADERLKADRLEKQIEDAKPENQPITSVAAILSFTIEGRAISESKVMVQENPFDIYGVGEVCGELKCFSGLTESVCLICRHLKIVSLPDDIVIVTMPFEQSPQLNPPLRWNEHDTELLHSEPFQIKPKPIIQVSFSEVTGKKVKAINDVTSISLALFLKNAEFRYIRDGTMTFFVNGNPERTFPLPITIKGIGSDINPYLLHDLEKK